MPRVAVQAEINIHWSHGRRKLLTLRQVTQVPASVADPEAHACARATGDGNRNFWTGAAIVEGGGMWAFPEKYVVDESTLTTEIVE